LPLYARQKLAQRRNLIVDLGHIFSETVGNSKHFSATQLLGHLSPPAHPLRLRFGGFHVDAVRHIHTYLLTYIVDYSRVQTDRSWQTMKLDFALLMSLGWLLVAVSVSSGRTIVWDDSSSSDSDDSDDSSWRYVTAAAHLTRPKLH